MAEDATTKETVTDQAQSKAPQFAIERIYVKDISLEAPRGPEAFKTWQPTVNLDISTKQITLEEGLHEVVLTLTLNVKEKESEAVYFLIEIQQAGLFRTANIPDPELRRVLASVAPSTLFPYARESVDNLAVKAGFPPLRFAPINFDALLQAAMQKQSEESPPSDETIQ